MCLSGHHYGLRLWIQTYLIWVIFFCSAHDDVVFGNNKTKNKSWIGPISFPLADLSPQILVVCVFLPRFIITKQTGLQPEREITNMKKKSRSTQDRQSLLPFWSSSYGINNACIFYSYLITNWYLRYFILFFYFCNNYFKLQNEWFLLLCTIEITKRSIDVL